MNAPDATRLVLYSVILHPVVDFIAHLDTIQEQNPKLNVASAPAVQSRVTLGNIFHTYGWNLPGSTEVLAECHQIICKANVLLGSFFQRIAQILLRSFNER